MFGIFVFVCVLAQTCAGTLPKYELPGNIIPMEYYQDNVLTSIQCRSTITLEKIKFKEDIDRLSWDVAHPRIIDDQIVFFIKHRVTNDIATCATPINYTDPTSLIYVTSHKDADGYFTYDSVSCCAFWEENDEKIAWCPHEAYLGPHINTNYLNSIKHSSVTFQEILIQRRLNFDKLSSFARHEILIHHFDQRGRNKDNMEITFSVILRHLIIILYDLLIEILVYVINNLSYVLRIIAVMLFAVMQFFY